MRVSGVVERVFSKDGAAGTTWGLKVGEQMYGFYKTKPECKEGQTVEFEAVQKGNFLNADPKTLKVKADAYPATGVVTAGSTLPNRSSTYLGDKDKQGIIARQWAVNAAVNYLVLSKDLDALPLPKAGKDRQDALRAMLDKIADEFYRNAMGLDKAAPTEAGVSVEPDELEAKASSDKMWE